MPDKEKDIEKSCMIISSCYCLVAMMVYSTYLPWEEGIIMRIVSCICMFVAAIIVGTINGGLIGSLLEHKISCDSKSWKYLAILLVCNLASPLIMCIVLLYGPKED